MLPELLTRVGPVLRRCDNQAVVRLGSSCRRRRQHVLTSPPVRDMKRKFIPGNDSKLAPYVLSVQRQIVFDINKSRSPAAGGTKPVVTNVLWGRFDQAGSREASCCRQGLMIGAVFLSLIIYNADQWHGSSSSCVGCQFSRTAAARSARRPAASQVQLQQPRGLLGLLAPPRPGYDEAAHQQPFDMWVILLTIT